MKNKKRIPKYPQGGKFERGLKDYGLGIADTLLGTVGANNVIKDSQYSNTQFGNAAKQVSGIAGSVGKAALPIAANVIAPGSGQFVSAGQQAIGQFNPQDASQFDEYGNPINPNMQTAQQAIGMAGQMGSQFFAMGGMNMQPNAEIESEENVVAPNGGFLQANGPTHSQGGVPVALPGNSMIFSDRLKLGKKTFAELNKDNNTNKEDKILESNKYGNTSKSTAELMKMAKNKNSEMLFKAQEALKRAKIEAYAKKMGVTLPQAQEAPEEGMQYPMGGKLPMYPLGSPVDNTKFTPGQRQQAYNDSMTLYKSGLGNQANFKVPGSNAALHSLHLLNKEFPTPVSTRNVNTPAGTEVVSQYQKPVYDPSMVKKAKPVSYPMINMPMKGLENPSLNFNPQLQQVPANSKPGSSKINVLPNYSIKTRFDSQGNAVDKEYFDTMNPERRIDVTEFGNGGRMLPKYKNGKFTPMVNNPDEEIIVPGGPQYNPDFSGVLAPSPYDNQMDITSANTLGKSAWEVDYMNNPNAPKPMTETPQQSSKFDWKGAGSNLAMGLANNAGNIYNLSRYNKPEVETYDRMNATYLDPSASLRDADMQSRRAEYNVRGASGGNAGTYLGNRVALNAQNVINKDRIQKEYQNVNAGISNSVGQYNNELSRQEVIANAQNRARNRSGKGEAIGSMGSNIANQIMDNKKGNMDQETLQLMMKYYDTPEFQKIMKNYKGKK